MVEKELQVAKEDAIKEINKVTHQKLEEIDNRKDLTTDQKAIAKAQRNQIIASAHLLGEKHKAEHKLGKVVSNRTNCK